MCRVNVTLCHITQWLKNAQWNSLREIWAQCSLKAINCSRPTMLAAVFFPKFSLKHYRKFDPSQMMLHVVHAYWHYAVTSSSSKCCHGFRRISRTDKTRSHHFHWAKREGELLLRDGLRPVKDVIVSDTHEPCDGQDGAPSHSNSAKNILAYCDMRTPGK